MKAASSLMVLIAGAALALAPADGALSRPRSGRTYTVSLRAMAFGPAPKTLHVGDTIVWINDDIFRHTATAKDGRFDVDLKPKSEGRTLLTTPGRVIFYCRYHPGMSGTLNVVRQ